VCGSVGGGLSGMLRSFVCRGLCLSGGQSGSCNVGISALLKLVDGFCCLVTCWVWMGMLVRLWRLGFGLDGVGWAVGAIACRWGYIIDGEGETVRQLCAGWCVAWKWDLACVKREWGGALVGGVRVVGWMCGVGVKDGSSKWIIERETGIR